MNKDKSNVTLIQERVNLPRRGNFENLLTQASKSNKHETVGFSEKPTIFKLGKREKTILKCLNKNLELKLIEIIKSCEPSLKYRTFSSRKERKRLEAYYLSSLKSLMRKDLVWKHKATEEKKLYTWDGGDFRPEWYSTLTSKPTFYRLTNEGLDFMEKESYQF